MPQPEKGASHERADKGKEPGWGFGDAKGSRHPKAVGQNHKIGELDFAVGVKVASRPFLIGFAKMVGENYEVRKLDIAIEVDIPIKLVRDAQEIVPESPEKSA